MKLQVRIIEHSRCVSSQRHEELLAEKIKDLEDYQVKFITDNGNNYTVFYSKDSDKPPLIRKTDYDRIYQSRKDILNKETFQEKQYKEAEKNEMFARFGIEDIEELKDTKKLETVGGGRCYEIPTINKKVGGGGLNLTKSFVQMDKEDIAAAIAYLFDYANSIVMGINPYKGSKISELIVRLRKQIGNDDP